MNELQLSSEKFRAILVVVATLGMILFNALAATGYVNGVTPDVISDKYPTIMTPAGYAFSIWSLIYIGLLAFSVYQILPANILKFRAIRTFYVVSCALNCAWIYFWHREAIAICLLIIIGLLSVLILIVARTKETDSARDALFTSAPFGIYAGWVTAATLVNFTIFLNFSNIGLSPFGWNVLGCTLLILSALASLAVRIKFRNFLYPLAVGWAATAIAIGQSGNTAIIVASAIATVICLILSISFVMDLKSASK
jgi:hypothetical protein